MSSLRQRIMEWLALARTRLTRAGVVRTRAPRQAPEQALSWHAHDLAERIARRGRRAMGQHRTGSPLGGQAVLRRYGARFYSAIGALGGAAVAGERGAEYMHDIGVRGGATTRQRYGREHYAEIGRKGGLAGRGKPRPRKRPAGQLELPL